MPRIAESLKEAGYGLQFAEGLGSLFKKIRDDNNQEQFNQIMQEAMNNLRSTYREDTPKIIAPPNTLLGETIFKPPKLNDQNNTNQEPDSPKAFSDMFGTTDFNKLEKEGRLLNYRPEERRRIKQQEVFSDFIQKALKIKNLDPEKLKLGLQNLQMDASANNPIKETKEYRDFNPEHDIYSINNFGDIELIRPGKKTTKEDWKNIGSYTGADGYNYVRIMGNDGVIKEVRSDNKVRPQKSTVINFKPPKSEKWKDFGTYINNIDYKEDPNTGKIVPTTPEEKKLNRQIAKNYAIGNMLPRAVNWYNTEIKQKWGAENISMADFEREIQESYEAGELSPEEAQDLLDMNQYRPFLFDMLRDTARHDNGEQ